MTAKTQGWEVGMEVFVSPPRWQIRAGQLRKKIVTKVGRDWVYFGRDRFDPVTFIVDGLSGSAVFLSEADYRRTVERDLLWSVLRRSLPHSPPNGITHEQIRSFMMACGIRERPDAEVMA